MGWVGLGPRIFDLPNVGLGPYFRQPNLPNNPLGQGNPSGQPYRPGTLLARKSTCRHDTMTHNFLFGTLHGNALFHACTPLNRTSLLSRVHVSTVCDCHATLVRNIYMQYEQTTKQSTQKRITAILSYLS